jgi:hypothetical protein
MFQVNQEAEADKFNEEITGILSKAYNEICPIRVARTSRPSDLVTDEVERIKKKRKRTLHKFNETKDPDLLDKISKLDKKLKVTINKVRRNLIRKKMEANNKSSFWDTVKNLQGEAKSKEDIELETDQGLIKEPLIVANKFDEFFENKVLGLSESAGPYQWTKTAHTINITEKDVTDALKQLENKMCCGEDGLPLKIIKDAAPGFEPELYYYYCKKHRRLFPKHGKPRLLPLFTNLKEKRM